MSDQQTVKGVAVVGRELSHCEAMRRGQCQAAHPFFTVLDDWVNLRLVETRTFPGGVVLTRYAVTP